MESSGIRNRNIEKTQNMSNEINTQSKLDIVPIDSYNCLDGRHRSVKVKCYNYKEQIYATLKDGFLIKFKENGKYHSVIGRLVNNNIISLTDEEQKICLSEGFLLEDTKKYQGYFGFFGL